MNNRIFKTLLCFIVIAAVFLSGTVFAASPNSVAAFSMYSGSYLMFAEGDAVTIYSSYVEYPYTTNNETTTVTSEIEDLKLYTIYGGGEYYRDTSSLVLDGGNVVAIYGGGLNAAVANSVINIESGTVSTVYGGSNAATSFDAEIYINGGTVGTVFGSGYDETGDYPLTSGGYLIMLSGGTVENIYGMSSTQAVDPVNTPAISGDIMLSGGEITGEALAVENNAATDYTYNYSLGIALSADLTLSGEDSVIGSSDYPVNDLYAEYDIETQEAPVVIVSNENREAGDVIAYFSDDVIAENTEEAILAYFSSEYYDFELSENNVVIAEEEVVEPDEPEVDPDEPVIPDEPEVDPDEPVIPDDPVEPDEDTVVPDEDDEDREAFPSEYTAGGLTGSSDSQESGSSYYVDGKYDGGYYSSSEQAEKAEQTNQVKVDGEDDITSFQSEIFGETGIEDDGYGIEIYEEAVGSIEETADGNYLFDGNEYSSVEEAVNAASESVKQSIYIRNLEKLVEAVANAAHYCDTEEVQGLYSSGSVSISQVSYTDASRLSEIYAEVMDTISVSQSILNAASGITDVCDTLYESGILTADGESELQAKYDEILAMLESAKTNSEVEAIKGYFEEFILSLEITKISLTDESGNVIAVISQTAGMERESQILLSEISDVSAYQQLLENVIDSGDVAADNFLTSILGVSNTLEEMQLLGVYDISIDGEVSENSGKYTVKIKAPDGMEDIGTVKILHITDYGVELITAKLVDGYIIFETTSFSEFVILGSEATSLWYALIPLSLLALLICAYVYVSRKEEKEANCGR